MHLKVPAPAQALAVGILMWLVTMVLPGWVFSFPGQGLMAVVLTVAGFAIAMVAFAAFVRRKTTVSPLAPAAASTLVVTGIYQVSRNPMYLGLLLMLMGWAVWLGHPLNGGLLVLFVVYITVFQIKPEEEALAKKFGPSFENYRRRVRRWL